MLSVMYLMWCLIIWFMQEPTSQLLSAVMLPIASCASLGLIIMSVSCHQPRPSSTVPSSSGSSLGSSSACGLYALSLGVIRTPS